MSRWRRLADYFVVVGYEQDKDRDCGTGRILQRFPEKDWPDCPFTQSLELFCQPSGWSLSDKRLQPTFFVSVLTDVDADRHYCACLTFYEPFDQLPPLSQHDDEPDSALVPHSAMFAPKSLVLISQVECPETFKNCLGIIYTVYVEGHQSYPNCHIEDLVGNIIGCMTVPPPGGPQVRFTIGAGDRQVLQPPRSSTLPVTRTAVTVFFQELGIHNSLVLICAALADHKVLFMSQSYSRLTSASHALTSLIYPLKYSYVYIPLLPTALVEVLSTPTPFIAGIHSAAKDEVSELLDVIVADLDGGSVTIPECVHLPVMPEPMTSRAMKTLTMILSPDMLAADYAFPRNADKTSDPAMLDKEIRAVFLRFFAELFCGYRSCLQIIRIHPEPVIQFHKAKFLGHCNMADDEFLRRVLDSMSFQAFVHTRGPPLRVCDIFDDVFATLPEQLRIERDQPDKMLEHVKQLAADLHANENPPTSQPYVERIPQPTEGAYARVHLPIFPALDWVHVGKIIEKNLSKQEAQPKSSHTRPAPLRIVPIGSQLTDDKAYLVNQTRRLEVLHSCVNFIFESKISDARKIFPAVVRALKNRTARLALTDNLKNYAVNNKYMLEHQQFDLVVRLLNAALQNESSIDENGIASAILPLAVAFYRKLCTGVFQFAYSCIQEHAVWASQQFWEATFYDDVQKQIKQLYVRQYEASLLRPAQQQPSIQSGNVRHGSHASTSIQSGNPAGGAAAVASQSPSLALPEVSTLEIAAEEMRKWTGLQPAEQDKMISEEEAIAFSLVIHYSNLMTYLRVPLDTSKGVRSVFGGGELGGSAGETSNSNVTPSVADSGSADGESGFEDTEVSEVGAAVLRSVSRFVDKVCGESGVTDDHLLALHQMIPSSVSMHVEMLEAVNRESKRLPPIQKPKIVMPTLLPGEEPVMEGLRVYLMPDGREEGQGLSNGGPALLPAEGAIFLTTYRIVFKGTPCDPLACEQTVIRAFPVATLTREKKLNSQYLVNVEQWLRNILQIRSASFQLVKIGFDEEVDDESLDSFRKRLQKLRYPENALDTFAFLGACVVPLAPDQKRKDKQRSLRVIAKKAFHKAAEKAGIKSSSPSSRKPKYLLSGGLSATSQPQQPMPSSSTMQWRNSIVSTDTESDYGGSDMAAHARLSQAHSSIYDEGQEDTWSVAEDGEQVHLPLSSDSKMLEKLSELLCCRDYDRIGLCNVSVPGMRSRTEQFRLSSVNGSYSVCRSYPALLVVPHNVTDDSIARFARCHRQNRFPVITWRHSKTRALLLRSSSFHSKSVMGKFGKPQSGGASVGQGGEASASNTAELEKYLLLVRTLTPQPSAGAVSGPAGGGALPDATARASTLSSAGVSMLPSAMYVHATPQTARRTGPFARFGLMHGSSGGPAAAAASIGARQRSSSTTMGSTRPGARGSTTDRTQLLSATLMADGGSQPTEPALSHAQLYIFCEKSHVKHLKTEHLSKCEFIPIDYRDVPTLKTSFKKLLRACVPGAVNTDPEYSFYKAIEASGWMLQLQNIMQLAGAAVDLLDVQGSSVLIALEDGWDITAQVVSVAQLLLDPYYRTFEGFRALVEKEWLSFGHRFSHRSCQTCTSQLGSIAPVFLQFLDVVHQVHHQFPMSFEFNQFYIKFLAYHYTSNRFRTFMMDCEHERLEAGWLLDDRPKALLGSDSKGVNMGVSIWNYIDIQNSKSAVFHNFFYMPSEDIDQVLRPYSRLTSLKVWDYYITEDLGQGPAYDFETAAKELRNSDSGDVHEQGPDFSDRIIVNACYDNINTVMPHAFLALFQEMTSLQAELGHVNPKWSAQWKKVERAQREKFKRQYSLSTQYIRSHSRAVHKRSTIEFLVKGKMVTEASEMFSQPHAFEKHHFGTPASCDYCSHILWGFMKTGLKCTNCGYTCHEKCMSHVPKNCAKLRALGATAEAGASNYSATTSGSGPAATINIGRSTPGTTVGMVSHDRSSTEGRTNKHAPNPAEHRTHEGYLYKQGMLLKGWKQRWFVLDSVKHQLRYYDSQEDTATCRGFIDLADAQTVCATKPLPGVPKKSDDTAFFELKTAKRSYVFLAADHEAAQQWIDEIQSRIQ